MTMNLYLMFMHLKIKEAVDFENRFADATEE